MAPSRRRSNGSAAPAEAVAAPPAQAATLRPRVTSPANAARVRAIEPGSRISAAHQWCAYRIASSSCANCVGSVSGRRWRWRTADATSCSITCWKSRNSRTSRSRTGPSASSSSTTAAKNGQLPGSPALPGHSSQRSNTPWIRGSPAASVFAGATTVFWNSSAARFSVASCSASLEPKCANSPLFVRPTLSASGWRFRPVSPCRQAVSTADCRIA
jgi:hypothetical protein